MNSCLLSPSRSLATLLPKRSKCACWYNHRNTHMERCRRRSFGSREAMIGLKDGPRLVYPAPEDRVPVRLVWLCVPRRSDSRDLQNAVASPCRGPRDAPLPLLRRRGTGNGSPCRHPTAERLLLPLLRLRLLGLTELPVRLQRELRRTQRRRPGGGSGKAAAKGSPADARCRVPESESARKLRLGFRSVPGTRTAAPAPPARPARRSAEISCRDF